MSELADRLAEKAGLKKREAQAFLTAVIDTIREGVNNDKMVKIKGLGTFKVIDVDARESVNVNTGERVVISGHQKLTFTPDAAMKELVNKPFSQFETVVLNEGVVFDDVEATDTTESADEVVLDADLTDSSDLTDSNAEEETDASVVEPEPEPEILAEPEPEIIAEPEPEPAPVEDKIPVVDETPAEDETPVEEEEESKHSYWWLWLLIAIIACVLSFAGGYLYGRHIDRTDVNDEAEKVDTTAVAPVVATVVSDSLQKDSVNTDTLKKEQVTTAEPVAEQETKPAEQPKEQPKQVDADAEWKKYEEMDVRVRTGAYKIVGTDHVVKVKSGDTMTRIAKRTLGEGMECYIEVYNNITSGQQLKEGQDIKIPKLEWKKKKK